MITVEEAIQRAKPIDKKDNLGNERKSYNTVSEKNEIEVMHAMMNDFDYKVKTYNKKGYVGSYYPSRSFKNTISEIIQDISGISKLESDNLINQYEFTEKQAKDMVNFSKEFINTYVMKTGRKLPLGGRERSNVILKSKTIEDKFVKYPNKISEFDGTNIFETKTKYRHGYDTIVSLKSYPVWINNNNN